MRIRLRTKKPRTGENPGPIFSTWAVAGLKLATVNGVIYDLSKCQNQGETNCFPMVAAMKIAAISIADYAEATEGMPHDVERLFFRMLLKMYSREGGLPDDDAENARMFGYDTRRYKRLKDLLLNFPCGMSIQNDEIRNLRIDAELPEIAARRQKFRDAGAKGGRSNASRHEVEAKSDGSPIEVEAKSDRSPIASDMQQQTISTTCLNPSPSPSPSPSPEERKSDRSTLSLDGLIEEVWAATDGRMIDDHDDPTALLRSWLKLGASHDDIVETIREVASKKRHESIDHFGFFKNSVLEAIEDRKAGRRNRHVTEKPLTAQEWIAKKFAEAGMVNLGEAHAHGSA